MDSDFGFAPAPRDTLEPQLVPLYRLRRGDHPHTFTLFYTTALAEHDAAVAHFRYLRDGMTCLVFDGPAPGTVSLLRLWHGPSQRHVYTGDARVLAATLATGGSRSEGVTGFIYPGAVVETRPLQALHHRLSGAQLFTVSEAERDLALRHGGYEAVGIVGWVFPAETSAATR